MKKIVHVTLCSIFYILCSTPIVRAASEFTTSFHSLYTVEQSGTTSVIHTIALRNNLSHIYATNYSFAISGDQLVNITASDEIGRIPISTTIQDGLTTIHLNIDRPSIGKDQVKTMTLAYQTNDVIEKIGDTVTINIPRLSRANEAQEYTRVVRVEGVGDTLAYIYPPQSKTEPDGSYITYTFFGHQNESLTLLFGQSVTYKLKLAYELKNKELSTLDSELALPPDTSYQHVQISNLIPPPTRIEVDENGNWLARYPLRPQEKLLVTAELLVTVYPVPTLYDPSTTTMQKTPHSQYWNTTAAPIVDLAGRLKTPENIYQYLVSNLTYNYSGIGTSTRKGALSAITSPSLALCTEFTDAFVSLARVNHIPSREINGFGYTKNNLLQPQRDGQDILHSWPEYYSTEKQQWIQVDPTWGHTTGGIDFFNKLDFSHIAFVRHGSEDSYPLPAGAYKSNASDRHILVEVTNPVEPVQKSEVRIEGGKNVLYNLGSTAIVNTAIDIAGQEVLVAYLPPFGKFEITPPGQSYFWDLWDKIKNFIIQLAT